MSGVEMEGGGEERKTGLVGLGDVLNIIKHSNLLDSQKASLFAEIGKLSISQEGTTRLVAERIVAERIEEVFHKLGTPFSTLNSNERGIIGDSLETLFPGIKRELHRSYIGGHRQA